MSRKVDNIKFFEELYFLCKKHKVTINGFDDGLTFYFENKYDIQPVKSAYYFGNETVKQLAKLIEAQMTQENLYLYNQMENK